MRQSDTKNIIRNHYRKLNRLIKIVNKHFETEAIHQMRVAYKKLRAFLRMMSEEKPGLDKIKIPAKLKRGYHIAGCIRDLQLQRQIILSHTRAEIVEPKGYLNLLKQNIKKLSPQFSDVPLKKVIEKDIKKTQNSLGNEIDSTVAIKFINNNCEAIIAIADNGDFTDVNLHAIRKHLKDIFYIIHELAAEDEEIKFNDVTISKNEKKQLDPYLEELGNFQDKCTSIKLLEEEWLDSLSISEQRILRRVKATLTVDKNEIKNILINKLSTEIIPLLQLFCNNDLVMLSY
jgi:CHAD domain-containing protein